MLRSLAPDGGYNLRHVLGQGLTTGVTQLVVWLYDVLRYRLPAFLAARRGEVPPTESVPGLRLHEMLAVAHTTVAAVNVGKVAVTQNPLLLNLPQVMKATQSLARVSLTQLRRYDHGARIERNRLLLDQGWEEVSATCAVPTDDALRALPDGVLSIG